MLNFVTAQSLNNTSGGWSGISANCYHQLQKRFPTNYVGPIYPRIPRIAKARSKVTRLLGGKGGLPIYGQTRLRNIQRQWAELRKSDVDFDMFHAATEWSYCSPNKPYGTYIDATFRKYMEIYANETAFSQTDVQNIVDRERVWLRNAAAVFFGSGWMRDIAIADYNLDPKKCHVMWVGGNVPVPALDTFEGGKRFLFISLNFEKKGGFVATEALRIVQQTHPDAELLVLGQKPPESVLRKPGVSYGGMLRKTVDNELNAFCGHLASARALIHPTSMDANPLVVIEAGYFGCPSVASRRFGIPELVLDQKTGLLIDLPITVQQVAEHMKTLLEDGNAYANMRRAVRDDTTSRLTWSAFGDRMAGILSEWLRAPQFEPL